ncbi:PLC-like phosphodiesterase [Cunninghamella echinulata]|nr:PLC-like phosphodiesterase [Cunninghamella echinulata]
MSKKDFDVKLPKVFSHRGYSGKYPENTLISFEEALKANTDALEGDIRLSKDKEIVMMHDLTLQRTTTGHGPVSDHPWVGYIDGLTTKTEQPQPIPRFRDVLDLLIRPDTASKQDLTMIVDIKFDNDIEILDHLYALIEEEYKDHVQVLRRQLIIGIWNPDYLKKTRDLFKDHYQVCFIGISLPGARKHFLHHVDYFSLPFAAYVDTEGQQFIQQVHELKKKVLTWTINDVEQMRSSVVWGLDGVVGDHVDLLLDTVQHQVLALSNEEYKAFLDSFQNIKSRRSRWYYYCMKKGMQVGSAFIGV